MMLIPGAVEPLGRRGSGTLLACRRHGTVEEDKDKGCNISRQIFADDDDGDENIESKVNGGDKYDTEDENDDDTREAGPFQLSPAHCSSGCSGMSSPAALFDNGCYDIK